MSDNNSTDKHQPLSVQEQIDWLENLKRSSTFQDVIPKLNDIISSLHKLERLDFYPHIGSSGEYNQPKTSGK